MPRKAVWWLATHDTNNYLLAVYNNAGSFYWHEHYNGGWPTQAGVVPPIDLVAGQPVGCYPVFIDRGYQEMRQARPDGYAASLAAAARLVLSLI